MEFTVAIHDNGSEINLINRELVEQLSNLPTMGRIQIKRVGGPAVETDSTLLDRPISPTASESYFINIASPLWEALAICDGLNESLLLTADTVWRLKAMKVL